MLARTLLILLAVVATEFAATTFLFERSQHFALQDDEAQRLADHLSVAHRLLDRAAVADRPRLTRELDTQGFDIEWAAQGTATPDSFRLNQLRDQVLHFAHDGARLPGGTGKSDPSRSLQVTLALESAICNTIQCGTVLIEQHNDRSIETS